jgi:hypothetical protein
MVRRVLETDPIGTYPRRLWDRSPRFQQDMLRRFGASAREANPLGRRDKFLDELAPFDFQFMIAAGVGQMAGLPPNGQR